LKLAGLGLAGFFCILAEKKNKTRIFAYGSRTAAIFLFSFSFSPFFCASGGYFKTLRLTLALALALGLALAFFLWHLTCDLALNLNFNLKP